MIISRLFPDKKLHIIDEHDAIPTLILSLENKEISTLSMFELIKLFVGC
jgi:hypothetical protein